MDYGHAMLGQSFDDWEPLAPLQGLALQEVLERGARFTTDAGPLTVEAYAPGVLRLRLGEAASPDYGIIAAPPATRAARLEEITGGWRLHGDDATLLLMRDPVHVAVERDGSTLMRAPRDSHFRRRFRLPPFVRTPSGWLVAFDLEEGEPVYGHGEKWGPLNHRGQFLRSWTEDALGVNAEISYKNCPLAWSPRGWSVFVHTPGRVHHAVGHPTWSHRSYAIEVEGEALDLFLLVADTPADLLERYTWLTGRPPGVPRWSLSPWISKAYYRDADELLATAQRVRELGLPIEVITLDGRAWQETSTRFAFEWDRSRYPEPREVTTELARLGFRLCVWEYPLVSIHHPLFDDMAARGWLLKDQRTGETLHYSWAPVPLAATLTPLPESGIVDFTHPDAYAYWRDRHRALFEDGVAVIKSDFGEQVPCHALAHNGDSGTRLHSVYPLLYNRCVFEATESYFGQGLVWGRAGWAGSQRYPTQWGGDPQSDWGGLAASIRGMLSWANSGVGWYASDIGGFYGGQPDAELFVRWAQAAVFASFMRFHGVGAREPWAFGDEALGHIRAALDLRMRLVPYIEACLEEATRTGLPITRCMALACPDQPESWAFDLQYLFGPELLVAPVVRPGGEVQLWLPGGAWRDAHSGERLAGARRLDRRLGLDQIALYVRAGSALEAAVPLF